MKLIDLPFTLTKDEKLSLQNSILDANFLRGKMFAKLIIVIETTLSIMDIFSSFTNVHQSFHFHFYLLMYMLMVFMNIFFLIIARKYEQLKQNKASVIRPFEKFFLFYITLFMVWGSIISLADQRLYGQLIAFVINVMSGSVIFYMNNKKVLLPYGIATILLLAGLPFFQSSSNILIGHYINLSIFIFFSWIASRILYQNFCSNFYSKILLKKANRLLKEEIEENKSIRQKLEKANEELRNLTLVDELTGIPNRRAFNQYVDFLLQHQVKKDSLISIIMLDIDYFKLFNDHYGHAEGDKVIKRVGQKINETIRHPLDFAARIGGEEFVYIAFNTDENEIISLAESILNKVRELKIPHNYSKASHLVTASLGTVSGIIRNKDDFDIIMRYADQALYTVKSIGRNGIYSLDLLSKTNT